ncbi:MAG: prolyl oligopeptidase family serine peptidase [Gemmatimonadales bacterium]
MRPHRSAALLVLLAAGCSGGTQPSSGTDWLDVSVTFQDAAIVVERVSYRSDGLVVQGQVCRPADSARHPVLIFAHGGWVGLGTELDPAVSLCAALARFGSVMVEPSYRGEDGSEGAIELCQGESRDLARMLAVVRSRPYTDTTSLRALGGSHGGCVLLRALAEGLPVSRAAVDYPAVVWTEIYDSLIARYAGATPTQQAAYQYVLDGVTLYLGGTPATQPAAYAVRDLTPLVALLASYPGKLLLQQGVNDDIVPAVQSCRLAAQMTAFFSYHVAVDSTTIATAPASCSGNGLTWRTDLIPLGSWPGARYLIQYDSVDHSGGLLRPLLNTHTLDFLYAP